MIKPQHQQNQFISQHSEAITGPTDLQEKENVKMGLPRKWENKQCVHV